MKDELGGKIMKEFVGLGAKTYFYVIDDDSYDKKAKGRIRNVMMPRQLIMTLESHYSSKLELKKLECEIIQETAKILALLSGNIDKYEYRIGEEIIASGPSQIIQQAIACFII